MLKQPKAQAILQTRIDDLAQQYNKAKPVVDHYQTLKQNALTLHAAAKAAEADAQRLRAETRTLLGQLMGRPSKEIRTKNAEQRAAIEMAEDYRDLAENLNDDIILAHIDAHRAAEGIPGARNNIVNAYTDLMLEEALREIAPRLKYALRSIRDSRRYYSPEVLAYSKDPEGLREAHYRAFIMDAISRAIADAEPEPVPANVNEALAAYPRFSVPHLTPATIHRLKCEMDARRKQREAAARK